MVQPMEKRGYGPKAATPSTFGGADRIRTGDLRVANAPLSQLSYSPTILLLLRLRAIVCLLPPGVGPDDPNQTNYNS
jgi:hypothetical protein